MKIDDNILQQIEQLAKLNVGQQEQAKTIEKIVGVLDMLDKVKMADIEDLEPLYHPLEIQQAMREDIADGDIPRDAIQAQSPQVAEGLFLVPKVIE
ncbi:MAG: Asp-tRNA(Asn)/Glu-tRNA(Gln) amidotransferase GatCAB subunit C [Gammaproteobacteria bacterium]|nr:MAG: Asp-tRNA(Asn)/Glu-tRNA(Gln) amidotransferase GatCAB subunit C [Gammaproteobacteria bacterium]